MAINKNDDEPKMGRPTKYRPEYCEAIIDYFSKPAQTITKRTITTKTGAVIEEEIPRAIIFPTLERFAATIDVTKNTLIGWTEEHPDFLYAYMRAKELQKTVLIENGTAGLYQAQFTIFVAKNCTDMRDISTSEISGPGGGPLKITDPLNETERAARMLFLLEQAERRMIDAGPGCNSGDAE